MSFTPREHQFADEGQGKEDMTLPEQASWRVELARQIGCEPMRWIATAEAAAQAGAADDRLHGLPVEHGRPRSDWGLDLIVALR